ncbi:Alpha/Beta hydrolase protein [Mrakia frigida]|uniref:phosphoprotein phosphatase methylesterase 1 n=1 Tax=Mrakia frigida TaxID=29902 RepID=UPI003FCC1935
MSDLQKDFIKSKLAHLPPLSPPLDDEEEDGEQEELEDTFDETAPPPKVHKFRAPTSTYSPLQAVPEYFASTFIVTPSPAIASSSTSTSSNTFPSFRTYYTPPKPPAGGGTGSVLVLHHGGGEGALGFSVLAKEVREGSEGELGVISFDARGHGATPNPTSTAALLDLSLETLTSDFLAFLQTMFPNPKASPAFILVGHSMGAAPVLEASPQLQKLGYRVSGVAVLDVVEGSAIEALPLMLGIISSRPSTFRSVEEAIDWHVSSSTFLNPTSARLSVPSLLRPLPPPSTRFTWTTNLEATQPFWEGWYSGLSKKFLGVRAARMLVLAGADRIDKELMIAQMQGKFQYVVLPGCGHHLHQDVPEKLSELLIEFWQRNLPLDLSSIKKVGQI